MYAVGIEDKGEGVSNRIRRVESNLDSIEEEDEESEEESEESEAEEGSMNPSLDGSVSFTLADPKVLDCSICFLALTIPVYQCGNGHVVCSTCWEKIGNRCPTCASPTIYSRCRAIEKVLESVKVWCPNTKYGCRESFSYSMKQKHEKLCPFVPCSCPIVDCNFEDSSENLYRHFGNEHKKSAKHFRYDRLVSITLGVDEKFLILREEMDGTLFILNNKVETLGNVVTLSRIGHLMERCFMYELTAKDEADRSSTLRLQSFVNCTPKRFDSPASSGFLVVPSKFSCISRQLQMDLCFIIFTFVNLGS